MLARRAMTLIETVMSLTILMIVMGAMTSAVVVASRAMPGRNDRIDATLRGAQLTDRLLADLSYARTITLTGSTSLSAQVPDRDADTKDETIVYTWSGVKGEPLYRTINDQSAEVIADKVYDLGFSCLSRVATISTTVSQESSAQMLHYTPVLGLTPPSGFMNPYSGSTGTKDVTSSRWVAQYVQPILPEGATAWKLTRVMLPARTSGSNTGGSRIEIRTATAYPGGPTTTVIQDRQMVEWDLSSSFSWQTFNYSGVSGLAPNTGVWIVVRNSYNSPSATMAYQDKEVADHYAAYAESSDGSSWNVTQDAALAHVVYGTYTMPVTTTTTQTRATTLSFRLQTASDAGSVVESGVRLINEPVLVVNP